MAQKGQPGGNPGGTDRRFPGEKSTGHHPPGHSRPRDGPQTQKIPGGTGHISLSAPLSALIIITGALLWDLLLGDPPNRFHPVCLLGREISFLWKIRTGLAGEGPHRNRILFLWGLILVLLTVLPPLILTGAISLLPLIPAVVLSIPLLKGALSLRGLFSAGREIEEALRADDLEEARRLTGWHLVSRDTSDLSARDIAGCVIESIAENLTDSFISPLYWFLALGLPGAWFCRAVNTCDAMIGYRKDDYEWGGKAAARLDDGIHWIPARITAVCICLAAGTYRRASGRNAWAILRSDRKETDSPNAGWTMAATAGALGVSLEKKEYYCLNKGRRESSPEDLVPLFGLMTRAAIWSLMIPLLLLGGALWVA